MKETYSELVKNELCHLEFSVNASKYFLRSFFINNLTKKTVNDQEVWIVQSHFAFLARFVVANLKKLYDLRSVKVSFSQPKNNNLRRRFSVEFVGNFQQIVSDLELNQIIDVNKLEVQDAEAFMIGSFLSGGSINSPQNGNYHLEFQSFNLSYLETIDAILKKFKISKKNNIHQRRNKYILYVKRSEIIADILKFMGVTETLFRFEDLRIERDFFNNMRRLNNFDLSNLQKTAKSSSEIINMINVIKVKNKFKGLPEKLQLFCQLRLEHQEMSLSALALKMSERLNCSISRSNVWHMTNKIKDIYSKLVADKEV